MEHMRSFLILSCALVVLCKPCPLGIDKYFQLIDRNGDNFLGETEVSAFVSSLQPDDYSREPGLLASHVRVFIDHWSGKAGAAGIPKEAMVRSECENVHRPFLAEDPVPQQLHLAMTHDPTEMYVSWITNTTAKGGAPTVRFSSSGGANQTATGTSQTYHEGLPLGWHGWVHHVKLTGLTPGATYTYAVGDPTQGVWSDDHSFTARQVSGGSTRVAVWGDQGTIIPVGYRVSAMLASHISDFDLLLHVGDLCYAGTGSVSQGEFAEVWDIWGRQNEPVASRIPYMITVGNHEGYYNFTALVNRYVMPLDPTAGDGRFGNWWWSADHGAVHFVSLSTEQGLDSVTTEVSGCPSGVQLQWLEQDLQAAFARKQAGELQWIVASGHRPMYCSDQDEWNDHRPGAPIQTTLEPLFHKYGVDIYLSGHQHCYERIHPVLNGTVTTQPVNGVYHNPTSTLHVVLGTGGVFLDHKWVSPLPAWSAVHSGEWWGYGGFEFFNATHMHYSLHELSGKVRDEFWIVRS